MFVARYDTDRTPHQPTMARPFPITSAAVVEVVKAPYKRRSMDRFYGRSVMISLERFAWRYDPPEFP